MSTDAETLEQSLEELGVETRSTRPDEVADTVDEFVREPAVGVPLDRVDAELPASVRVDPPPAALKRAVTGVTPAEFAVADYGSLVLPSTAAGSELVSLFVDRHVAVIDESDVVPDMTAAFERFEADVPGEYRDAIVATGPSATADMGALVEGAHGPSEVRVVVVEA